jgi:hypothetical protein
MPNKFPSKYTDKEVSESQYLAERVCERKAAKEGQTLPYRFWNTKKWKREFLYQLQLANSLLKMYSFAAILKALNKHFQVFSLNAQFLDNTIKFEQAKIDKLNQLLANKPIEESPPVNTSEKPRPDFVEKPSTISKLRGL